MGKRRRKNAGEVMDRSESLPDDALLMIFSHISTRDLLSRVALVNKRWLGLVKSHSTHHVTFEFTPLKEFYHHQL